MQRLLVSGAVRTIYVSLGVKRLNKKIHILLSQVYCLWQVVKSPTIISNDPVESISTYRCVVLREAVKK